MKKFLLPLLFILLVQNIYAQSDEELSKIFKKADDLIEKKKEEDAEKLLKGFLSKYPSSGETWDKLSKLQFDQYYNSKKFDDLLFSGKVSLTVSDKNKKTKTDTVVDSGSKDSMVQNLMQMINSIKPSTRHYNDFISTCRQALISADDAFDCAIRLRNLWVDFTPDTAISNKAYDEFDIAEDNFANRNYFEAAKHYKKAIEIDPKFYKAKLYLGDVYYVTKNYDEAAAAFEIAVEAQPNLLEPVKYLVDAYARNGEYDKAYVKCIQALKVYPDFAMYRKFNDCCKLLNKEERLNWVRRDVLPNKMGGDDLDIEANSKSPWTFYKEGFKKISAFCDSSGIIKPNKLTDTKYLEVYSWEEMLKNTDDPQFDYAKRIMKKGYLDCYVFIDCFHPDYYAQYKDFVKNHEEKINTYFQLMATGFKE